MKWDRVDSHAMAASSTKTRGPRASFQTGESSTVGVGSVGVVEGVCMGAILIAACCGSAVVARRM